MKKHSAKAGFLLVIYFLQWTLLPLHAFAWKVYKTERKQFVRQVFLEDGMKYTFLKSDPQIQWFEEDEFFYQDEMYDVVECKSGFIKAVKDKEEKKYIQQLKETQQTGDQKPTKKEVSVHCELGNMIYFLTTEMEVFIAYFIRDEMSIYQPVFRPPMVKM